MSLIGDRRGSSSGYYEKRCQHPPVPLDQQEEMLNGATVLKKKGQKKVASSSMQLNGTIRCKILPAFLKIHHIVYRLARSDNILILIGEWHRVKYNLRNNNAIKM